MIKQLISFLNYSVFAELALVMFAVVFIAVVVRTLRTSKISMDHQANIVLDEAAETTHE